MRETHGSTLAIDVDELIVGNHHCPECERDFSVDEWEERQGYYYPNDGGCTYYDCPEECNGTIAIHI